MFFYIMKEPKSTEVVIPFTMKSNGKMELTFIVNDFCYYLKKDNEVFWEISASEGACTYVCN